MTDSSATEDLDLEVEAVFQLSAEGVTPEKIKLFEEGQKEQLAQESIPEDFGKCTDIHNLTRSKQIERSIQKERQKVRKAAPNIRAALNQFVGAKLNIPALNQLIDRS